MDKLTAGQRSANMARIRSEDTAPELLLRRMLHRLGYRFRLHRRDLPGKPDLVFAGRRKVIFVHGCFWHQHPGCREGRVPGSHQDYWAPKLKRNQQRDAAAQAALKEQGWQYLVLWECDLKDAAAAVVRAKRFLGPVSRPASKRETR
jgi:DNA mismatch endonuclease, patch repair protein